MRSLLFAALVLCAACHDKTASDVNTADAGASRDGGRLHMIVDVSTEGPPKVEGTNEGQFVELRAEDTTPFARLVEGIDTAKHLGGGKFMVVVGSKRAKPFVAPPFDPSGGTTASDAVSLDDTGAITVNGTKVASANAAAEALGGDASAKAIAIAASKNARVGQMIDALVEIAKLGRPITLAVR